MRTEPHGDSRDGSLRWEPRGYLADGPECPAGDPPRPPQPRRRPRQQRYDRPAPGVVQLRITASCDEDIQELVARLAEAGLRPWQAKDRLYQHADGAVCRYYSTNLRD